MHKRVGFLTAFSWSFWNPFTCSSCSNQPFHSGDGNVLARGRQLYVSTMSQRSFHLLAKPLVGSKDVVELQKIYPIGNRDQPDHYPTPWRNTTRRNRALVAGSFEHRPRLRPPQSTPPRTSGSVALTDADATRSYRCCGLGSNIEQPINFPLLPASARPRFSPLPFRH
jgi:hypothetical protein